MAGSVDSSVPVAPVNVENWEDCDFAERSCALIYWRNKIKVSFIDSVKLVLFDKNLREHISFGCKHDYCCPFCLYRLNDVVVQHFLGLNFFRSTGFKRSTTRCNVHRSCGWFD